MNCSDCYQPLSKTDKVCPSCGASAVVEQRTHAPAYVVPWWQEKLATINLTRFKCNALQVPLSDPDIAAHFAALFDFDQGANFHKQNAQLSTVIRFLSMKPHEQDFIVSAKAQGVTYRGHSFDQFKTIAEHTLDFNNLDKSSADKYILAARLSFQEITKRKEPSTRC